MEGVRRIDERERPGRGCSPTASVVVEALANPERVKQSVTLTPRGVAGLLPGGRPPQRRRDLPPRRQRRRAGDPADPLSTCCGRASWAWSPPLRGAGRRVAPPSAARAGHARRCRTGKPEPLRAPSVEFSHGLRRSRKSEDDTQRDRAHRRRSSTWPTPSRLTVSRLVLVARTATRRRSRSSATAYTLGRHRNNDIVITDPKVSSFHAPHRPHGRRLRARRPQEPQRLLGQRQAHRGRAAQDRRRGPAGHGPPRLQGRLHLLGRESRR